jgi:hypothetical protein
MQECRRRISSHPRIAVGSASDDAFEEAQHAAHAIDPVECRDEMHFRGSRIRKTDIDAATDQGTYQTFRTVHESLSITVSPSPTLRRAAEAWLHRNSSFREQLLGVNRRAVTAKSHPTLACAVAKA